MLNVYIYAGIFKIHLLSLIGSLFLIACVGKSAQLGLHT
jgi:NADH:ubiquinone oxidoreductase subunit 5 (subunit L)/multisubunit Na+/H+ antiporter MnhA subunit